MSLWLRVAAAVFGLVIATGDAHSKLRLSVKKGAPRGVGEVSLTPSKRYWRKPAGETLRVKWQYEGFQIRSLRLEHDDGFLISTQDGMRRLEHRFHGTDVLVEPDGWRVRIVIGKPHVLELWGLANGHTLAAQHFLRPGGESRWGVFLRGAGSAMLASRVLNLWHKMLLGQALYKYRPYYSDPTIVNHWATDSSDFPVAEVIDDESDEPRRRLITTVRELPIRRPVIFTPGFLRMGVAVEFKKE
jgi:hypothetical protein